MAKRPFKVVLEEAVNGENTVEATAMSEAELELLKEEANKNDIDITEEVTAVEELIEEQNVVNTQIQENEEKLTDPDIIVDASDVEVSEECYKNVCYRLGIKAGTTLKFSNESTFNAVKAEPRKYLALSNEGLKEIVKNIWEKIKAFFKKIWNKILDFFAKIGLYKRAEMKELKEIEEACDEILKEVNGKDFKVNLYDALCGGGHISTESKKFSMSKEDSDSDLLFKAYYKRNPYIVTMLGYEDIKKVKIFDPINYERMVDISYKAVEMLPGVLSSIVKNDNQEQVIETTIKTSIDGIEKAIEMGTNYIYGNNKLAELTKEIVENSRELTSEWHPNLPTATHVEFIKVNKDAMRDAYTNGSNNKILEYKNCKYVEDIDDGMMAKIKNTEISIKDVETVCKHLQKQGGIFDDTWAKRTRSKQEAVSKKVDIAIKEFENRSDLEKWQKDASMIMINLLTEVHHPKAVAKCAKACVEHRKAAIKIMNNILNYAKANIKNK